MFEIVLYFLHNTSLLSFHVVLTLSIGVSFNSDMWYNLTHWGRVTHICVGNLTIIGSDNGWSPGRRQAITWTNVGILLIGPIGTNFSEMLIEIHTFSFNKIHLKMSSGRWRPFCLGLNVLINEANKTCTTAVKCVNSHSILGFLWRWCVCVSEVWPVFYHVTVIIRAWSCYIWSHYIGNV